MFNVELLTPVVVSPDPDDDALVPKLVIDTPGVSWQDLTGRDNQNGIPLNNVIRVCCKRISQMQVEFYETHPDYYVLHRDGEPDPIKGKFKKAVKVGGGAGKWRLTVRSPDPLSTEEIPLPDIGHGLDGTEKLRVVFRDGTGEVAVYRTTITIPSAYRIRLEDVLFDQTVFDQTARGTWRVLDGKRRPKEAIDEDEYSGPNGIIAYLEGRGFTNQEVVDSLGPTGNERTREKVAQDSVATCKIGNPGHGPIRTPDDVIDDELIRRRRG